MDKRNRYSKEHWDDCIERFKKSFNYTDEQVTELLIKNKIENIIPIEQRVYRTGDIGARSELLVCADLLNKEFSVFRSVSAQASFDLAAYRLKDKKLFRVEVKTSKLEGKIPKLTISQNNPENYDILALVLKSGEITYRPNLDDLK